jgi:hypothetical protein
MLLSRNDINCTYDGRTIFHRYEPSAFSTKTERKLAKKISRLIDHC